MRRALALALVLGGCADGKSVLHVSVSAAPPLAAVDHLRVTVTDLSRMPSRTSEPVFVPVAAALPPPRDFALVLPSTLDGTILLAVAAEEPSNRTLAAAEERIEVRPSREKAVALILGTPGADLAVPTDLAVADLAVADLAAPQDLASSRTPVRVARGANKMDILFVVDNSGTMLEKQTLLGAALPSLMTALRNFGATTPVSYHIGVITTDIGTGRFQVANCTRTTDMGLGGDGAKLVPRGQDAPAGCAPPTGARYLVYDQVSGSDNSPDAGTDAGTGQSLERTLECMVSVGSMGCGFEQTLEATWQALRGNIAENAGFLRPDALLAIVLLTDEDDCSALPTSDLFNLADTTTFGPPTSFRCTRHGIVCGSPPMPPPNANTDGGLPGCRSATAAEGSQLLPVDRYIQLLAAPAAQGGIKINPAELIVSAIVGNPTPFDIVLAAQGGTGYLTPCFPYNGTSCTYLLQRSCVAGGTIGADPAPRILEVVNATVNHQVTPICSTDYTGATSGLASMITAQLGPVCLPRALPDPGNPDCVVEDVTESGGSFTRAAIASCATSPLTRPCWRLANTPACPSLNGQQLSLVIDRSVTPGASTIPNAACQF